MYVVLAPEALDRPEAYPEWCSLSWFRNYRHLTGDVETHYHDLPEVYLWHEGTAAAVIAGQAVAMRPGLVAYTAAGDHHSYAVAGRHSNTGLAPKAFPGCRSGHLHTQTTGESPRPSVPSFWVAPEENPFAAPRELPRYCFARHIACARFTTAQTVLQRAATSWLALLMREGGIRVQADGQTLEVPENHLFIAAPGTRLCVVALSAAEVALAEGWPTEIPG